MQFGLFQWGVRLCTPVGLILAICLTGEAWADPHEYSPPQPVWDSMRFVATMYSESTNPDGKGSLCLTGSTRAGQRRGLWDLNHIAFCDRQQRPQCGEGFFKVVTAAGRVAKGWHKVGEYSACVAFVEDQGSQFVASFFGTMTMSNIPRSCTNGVDSSASMQGYWDLAAFSFCQQRRTPICRDPSKLLVTSMQANAAGEIDYNFACVIPQSTSPSRFVSGFLTTVEADGRTTCASDSAVPVLGQGAEWDELDYGYCEMDGRPRCQGSSQWLPLSSRERSDGSVEKYNTCLISDGQSGSSFLSYMNSVSTGAGGEVCGSVVWEQTDYVKCRDGQWFCPLGSQLMSLGVSPYPNRKVHHFACVSNLLLSSPPHPSLAREFSDGKTALVFAHQDDDVLWMHPFFPYAQRFVLSAYAAPPVYDPVLNAYPDPYRVNWFPIWGRSTTNEFVEFWLDKCKRAATLTVENLKQRLRPIIFDPAFSRFVTHNVWGEYGHIHHRYVSRAVRELAVEARKDVWAIALRTYPDRPWVNEDTGSFGLESIQGVFEHSNIESLRRVYQEQKVEISPGKFADTWTWGDGEFDYPYGTRAFTRLVGNGIDYSLGNAKILQMEASVPLAGHCQQ